MPPRIIDLRSDTVTRPTPAMRRAIFEAEVGDDMMGEDPTVNRLEAMVCERFGMEAAVYNCSGTQSNQMALRALCQTGDEILLEERSHIVCYEQGAPAALSGLSTRTFSAPRGIFDAGHLRDRVRPRDQHFAVTRLVVIENTTNLAGGYAWPLDKAAAVGAWANGAGLAVHVDGARLLNACVAKGYSPAEFLRHADTASLCFSKGLGCPMGSILAGPADVIARARRARKLFGGALRQAGMMAAAAIYALEHHVERLADDHRRAKELASRLAKLGPLIADPAEVETNLVFLGVDPAWGTAAELARRLGDRGVRLYDIGPQSLRLCTHLDVSDEDVGEVAEAFARVL